MDETRIDELCRTESDRIEWKESVRDAEGIVRAVCALANDLGARGGPGHVVIGLGKGGAVLGVDERGGSLDEEQQRLASRLTSTQLQPTPSVDVRAACHAGRALIVIAVEPYPVPPVVTVNQVAWVRVGTTTRRAHDADLARLRERRPEAARPFDSRACPQATLQDLDLSRLRDEHASEREADSHPESFPPLEQWLAARRESGHIVAGRFVPNVAAVLVFGSSPQSFLPGAVVDFVRYAGSGVDGPLVARKTITGPLPAQIDALDAQIQVHLAGRAATPDGIRQSFVPDYPLKALEELARNLVQHRSYEGTNAPSRVEWFDDRIELSNPGGPFGRASEGEFGSHADYRNPLLTKLLVQTGHVQFLARGVRLARAELQKNGNPPLEAVTDGFTRVIVRRRA